MKRAVFLDRDGVINKSLLIDGLPRPPENLDQLEILPGVDKALKMLKLNGFLLIVVTNQPDVARGLTSNAAVKAINDYLITTFPIDAIFVCTHDNEDNCICRKPKPGLLLDAAIQFQIDIKSSFLIGDRWRDIEAGQAAGCDCYFVDYGYLEKSPPKPFERVYSLLEASIDILGRASNEKIK
jgi:D-glycero-D-manno-heptose 1,7-bisphosphate phosphatase